MKIIKDLKEQNIVNGHKDAYYGTITIKREDIWNIIIIFNDLEKKFVNQLKINTNSKHKNGKIGKWIDNILKPHQTLIFKNVNFDLYSTAQPDILFSSIFNKTYI